MGLSLVVREDQQYVREVVCGFHGPNRLAQRTHDAFVAAIRVPAGFRVEDWTGGRLEDDEHARGLCTLALGIALVLLSVALGFDSAWAAAMVFLSLPLALAGVMAAFWTTGTAFTREAADGVILVVGLAVNQAILLVDAALERRRANVRLGAAAAARRARPLGDDRADHGEHADEPGCRWPCCGGAGRPGGLDESASPNKNQN